jgi:DNA-binding NarL/FixJ family response regulator
MSNQNVEVLVVVEDEPDMREVIRLTLARDARLHILGEAANAADAIELARTHDPGLIILDHSIEGDMMGLEAAPLLKEAAPRAVILLFTAYDMAAEARREPAVDAFLRKDELSRLLQTVDALLGLEQLPA